jgi:hypothetical protein
LNVFQANLRARAKRKSKDDFIVAQRLKRFSSVMDKLVREPQMKLSQMQDLGGCRAILPDIHLVDAIYNMYRGDEPLSEGESHLKCHDYIRQPKEDGYRSIHVVGRYSPRTERREPWRGQRIEIQLRTRLQHAFATAVETVTAFTKHPLKFGGGSIKWRRFFSLMGSALAAREMTPLVPGTPTDRDALIKELDSLTRSLQIIQRLQGWTVVVHSLQIPEDRAFRWILLVLNTKDNTINITPYADHKQAYLEIDKIEKDKRTYLDAVLVWVKSISDLRSAYPNYYADTREFIAALESALRSRERT